MKAIHCISLKCTLCTPKFLIKPHNSLLDSMWVAHRLFWFYTFAFGSTYRQLLRSPKYEVNCLPISVHLIHHFYNAQELNCPLKCRIWCQSLINTYLSSWSEWADVHSNLELHFKDLLHQEDKCLQTLTDWAIYCSQKILLQLQFNIIIIAASSTYNIKYSRFLVSK